MDNNYLPISFFQLINPDNTMSYNRFIAHAIGSTETIIYFSLIAKMTYYFKNGMLDDEGFFYATSIDIQESTTFTKRQQIPAINRLVEIGLIETKLAGLPKKKYFKVLNKQELLLQLIEKGEKIADNLRNNRNKCDKTQKLQNVTSSSNAAENADKPHKVQKLQNVTTGSDKMLPLEETKCNDSRLQNVPSVGDKMSPLYKSKDNNLKYNNLKSINPQSEQKSINGNPLNDTIDEIDGQEHIKNIILERRRIEQLVADNICYDEYLNDNAYDLYTKEIVKAMYNVIVEAICSTEPTLRVNSSDVPQPTVREVFLCLNYKHIDYVVEMLKENRPDITNLPAYLRTALYNAPNTMDMYYSSKVRAAGLI